VESVTADERRSRDAAGRRRDRGPRADRDRVGYAATSGGPLGASPRVPDAARGAAAGEKLRHHFADNGGWRSNRAARLFSFLTVTGEYLQYVKRANNEPIAGDRSYIEDFADPKFRPVDCTLTDEQTGFAKALLDRITAVEVPDDADPRSLASIVPPPWQTIRFLPEGEPPRRP
jgi:hypothetical protein